MRSIRRDFNIETWIEAANLAQFSFYEVADPAPEYRWSGGYGFRSSEDVVQLAIIHDVGDLQIQVITSTVDPEMPAEYRVSLPREDAMYGLLEEVFDHESSPELPIALIYTAKPKTLVVDGREVGFEGIRLEVNGETGGWSGTATVDGKDIAVTMLGGEAEQVALATCANWAMPDHERINRD